MKRFKNYVIGGIQSKLFRLILITVALLSALYIAMSLIHSDMLSRLVADSGEKQQSSIAGTTSSVMDQVVMQTLERSNRTEARIANDLFDGAKNRVVFLADCAGKLLAHPEDHAAAPWSGPDPKDDGTWTGKVIFAEGTDPADPAVAAKVGLLANLFDTMVSLCPSFGASTVYIGLPEGVHMTVGSTSSGWLEDGRPLRFDPRERQWYQQAAETGGLVFSEGEEDAVTGVYCVECAMPVYDPQGRLQAVIGTDLFLDEMEEVIKSGSLDGERALLVNQDGRAVLPPQAAVFPMAEADRGGDLRDSAFRQLGRVTGDAMKGFSVGVVSAELADGKYYITASPIEAAGWVLVSAYSQKIAGRPATTLQNNLEQIQKESQSTYQEKTKSYMTMALALLAAVTLITIYGALTLGRRIVAPLNSITKRISDLGGSDLEFQMEDSFRTGDEVEQLAEAFSSLSHKTAVYMDEVVRVTAEKERIGTELSLATEIQTSMLPHIFPAFPNRPDFDIYASADPAREVGGDFYDYFLIDSDHLCVEIADVSGKGVPAALFMMVSKIILQSVAMQGISPAEILRKTNEALCSNNEAEMFVTVWLGIVELSTGRLTAANAGHEYPVLMDPDGQFRLYKDRHGFVLGGMEGSVYREYELQLEPGAKLFIYTDGVPEANNPRGELFGTDRMLRALNEAPAAGPKDVLDNVKQSVSRFTEDAEQFDDLTMLCFQYFGPNRETNTAETE